MTEPTVSVECEGHIDTHLIPDYVRHNIVQTMIPAILTAWDDPEIRRQYRRWKEAKAPGVSAEN